MGGGHEEINLNSSSEIIHLIVCYSYSFALLVEMLRISW